MALRKQDHIDVSTFVILKYHEADNIVARWKKLLQDANEIDSETDDEHKAAFFQLVLQPIKASYLCTLLRVTQYKNQLYAKQRRNTANVLFHRCLEILDKDHDLTEEYHSINNGKWNHILRQPHYGYGDTGAQPSRNMIDGLCYVQTREDSNPSIGHMGIAVEGIEGINPGHINEDSDRTHPSRKWLEPGLTLPFITPYGAQERYFEVFHRGTKAFSWVAKPHHEWVKLSQYEGHLKSTDPDTRVIVTIDWPQVPVGFDEKIIIEITGTGDGYEQVHMTVRHIHVPDNFTGFVETSGHLAVETGKWAAPPYLSLPAVGHPVAGSVTLPNDTDFTVPDSLPFLHFPIYVLSDHENTNLELQFNMTLETDPKSRMEYDLRWDGGPINKYRLTDDDAGNDRALPRSWNVAVMDCVWRRSHNVGHATPGPHTIEIRFRKPNMILEKLILDLGDLRYTYLGPPEADYVVGKTSTTASIAQDDRLSLNFRY